MYTKSVLFAAALGLQQAAANWDLNASSFKCPGSTPTTCSPQQGGGWTFGGIPNGGFSGFDGFQFGCGASSGVSGSGWTCNSQFQGSSGGKRSLLRRTKGGSGGQCVESDLKNQPQISCSDRDFTAATFDLIADFDVDFTMECDQGNGQTCKQDGHCSKSGSSFQNTQCAGCKSITFKHKGSDSGSCGFGISSIGWECSTTKTSPSGPSTTLSLPGITTTSAQAIVSTTASLSIPSGGSSAPSPSSPTSSAQASSTISSAQVSSPTSSAQASPSTTSAPSIITTQTTSTVISTTEITITSCASTVTNCPAESTVVTTSTLTQYTTVCPVTLTQTPGGSSSAQALPSSSSVAAIPSSSVAAIPSSSSVALVPSSSVAAIPSSTLQTIASSSAQAGGSSTQPAAPGTTQEVLTTVIVTESTTICPVTATLTPSTGGSPIITTSLSTSVVTISSTSVIPASPVSSSSPQASSPAPGGCPSVVPSCLNTWLFSTSCKDNTDIGCFCSLTNYTSSVIGCITAYGADSSEISSALSYLQGICAPYVSANPGIVTAVPSTISVAPVPSGQPASTITVGSSAVTVPAVQFTTTSAAAIAGASTPAQVSPNLIPGAGSSVAAQSSALPGVTAPFPTGAPAAPAPTGTGAITGANPAATSPIPFAGSASKGTVSGLVGVGALVVAALAL